MRNEIINHPRYEKVVQIVEVGTGEDPLYGHFEMYSDCGTLYVSGGLWFDADPEAANGGMIEAGLLRDFDGAYGLPKYVKKYLLEEGHIEEEDL